MLDVAEVFRVVSIKGPSSCGDQQSCYQRYVRGVTSSRTDCNKILCDVHGMHLCKRDAEEDKVTCDSRIVASVWHRDQSTSRIPSLALNKHEYVGIVEEILKLDYQSHIVVVLVCSWIFATLDSSNPKIVRNKYGFVLGNFNSCIPLSQHLFCFPL
jgi:hypothetical protein